MKSLLITLLFWNISQAKQLDITISDRVSAVITYETEKIETGPATKYGHQIVAKNALLKVSFEDKAPKKFYLSVERTTSLSYTKDKQFVVLGQTYNSGAKVAYLHILPLAFIEVGYPGETKHEFVIRYSADGKTKRVPLKFIE